MRSASIAIAALSLLVGGAAIGCDEEIATERTVDVKDDKVVTDEKTVSETPEGGVKVTEEKKTEPIGN